MRQRLFEYEELHGAAKLAHRMMRGAGRQKNGDMLAAAAWIAAFIISESETDEKSVIYEQFLLTVTDILAAVEGVQEEKP
jgi:hypothetical protein